MKTCNLCHEHLDRENDKCKLTGKSLVLVNVAGYITPEECPKLQQTRTGKE